MKQLTYFKIKLWKDIPQVVCNNLYQKYKNNHLDYYHVVIFNSYEDMYEYSDKHFGEEITHDYGAICKYLSKVYYEDGIYVDKDKCCGWLLFCKDALGVGTVSHECTHATNYYFKYRITNHKKIFDSTEYDELFAYMLGSLVSQIYRKLYKRGVIQ